MRTSRSKVLLLRTLFVLFAALSPAALTGGCTQGLAAQPTGEPLDLSHLTLSFDDEFTTLDIAAHSGARWSAHTPWGGDFGDAAFTDPGPDTPFSITPDGLRITASKDIDGRWRSGLICSIDHDAPGSKGFSQKYGYFEMRARIPGGMGTWPAFWLIGTDKSKYSSEIDVMEFYGGFPGYYHAVTHLWQNGKDVRFVNHLVSVPEGSLSSNFNDFGILIDPKISTVYLNRKKVWSFPTPVEYQQPMYMLANLALGSGWPTSGLKGPQVMDIRYIKAFSLNSDYQAEPGS